MKDDLLGIVVSAKLKDAQSTFAEALAYRGKYLVETEAASQLELAYNMAAGTYDPDVATMNDCTKSSLSTWII